MSTAGFCDRTSAFDHLHLLLAVVVTRGGCDVAEPWNPNLVTARWIRHRKRFDLDNVRVHDLRHFVATELLTAGIDARTVANRLGHARTSTTLDIYWAWVPAQDQHPAHHLGTVLGPASAVVKPADQTFSGSS